MPRTVTLEYLPEDLAERIAKVMGSGQASAVARALEQMRVRREAGEDVHLWRVRGVVLVGPDPLANAEDAQP